MAALSDADVLRLRAVARLRARGLPGLDACDLFNEAVLRPLDGSRSRPSDVPLVAVLAVTMRGVAHDHWQRQRRERPIFLRSDGGADDIAARQPDPAPDPERVAAAAQALGDVDRLFAPADVVFVNAGAVRPADAWLDRLREGGRLVLPLTYAGGEGGTQGAVFLITRDGAG